jgi:hypothetical protein
MEPELMLCRIHVDVLEALIIWTSGALCLAQRVSCKVTQADDLGKLICISPQRLIDRLKSQHFYNSLISGLHRLDDLRQ